MNLGADFHDTITYSPEFFTTLYKVWPGKKYVITGTPDTVIDRKIVTNKLDEIGLLPHIDGLLMGYEYSKNAMNKEHFYKMGLHKLALIKNHNITTYFDDNPFYASFLRNYGVTVFQTIIDDLYLKRYEELGDKYFSCHLQKYQFQFLEHLDL